MGEEKLKLFTVDDAVQVHLGDVKQQRRPFMAQTKSTLNSN